MDTFTTLEAILLQLRKALKTGSVIDDWDEKCLYAEKALCLKSRYQLSDRCCLAASTTVDEAYIEHLSPEVETLNYHNLNDSFINFSEMKKRPKKMAHWNFPSILDFSVETRTDCKAI